MGKMLDWNVKLDVSLKGKKLKRAGSASRNNIRSAVDDEHNPRAALAIPVLQLLGTYLEEAMDLQEVALFIRAHDNDMLQLEKAPNAGRKAKRAQTIARDLGVEAFQSVLEAKLAAAICKLNHIVYDHGMVVAESAMEYAQMYPNISRSVENKVCQNFKFKMTEPMQAVYWTDRLPWQWTEQMAPLVLDEVESPWKSPTQMVSVLEDKIQQVREVFEPFLR